MEKYQEKFIALSKLIGNTPLLEINYLFNGRPRKIFGKAEWFNLTGSIKDRIALHIINKAYSEGLLKEGQSIVEATSGNTGISFASIGKFYGNPCVIFMPDYMSEERKKLLKSFGAKLILVSKEQGGFVGAIKLAKQYALDNKAFYPNQFENLENIQTHLLSTGKEIVRQCPNIDAFVSGVGTGGTIMGVANFLKNFNENIKIFAMEPKNSPTLSTGHKIGYHKIQGISDEFVPNIFDYSLIEEIIPINDNDAIDISQKLAKQLGLGVGISSGANILSAIILREFYSFNNVCTIIADDNKKYISTDLFEKCPKSEYDIQFIDYKVLI